MTLAERPKNRELLTVEIGKREGQLLKLKQVDSNPAEPVPLSTSTSPKSGQTGCYEVTIKNYCNYLDIFISKFDVALTSTSFFFIFSLGSIEQVCKNLFNWIKWSASIK